MEIIRLPAGQIASPESDCIRIQEREDGRFELEGSALLACGDGEAAESVSIVGGEPYAVFEAAEAAGLAWAGEHCVAQLFVSKSDGIEPLPYPVD